MPKASPYRHNCVNIMWGYIANIVCGLNIANILCYAYNLFGVWIENGYRQEG